MWAKPRLIFTSLPVPFLTPQPGTPNPIGCVTYHISLPYLISRTEQEMRVTGDLIILRNMSKLYQGYISRQTIVRAVSECESVWHGVHSLSIGLIILQNSKSVYIPLVQAKACCPASSLSCNCKSFAKNCSTFLFSPPSACQATHFLIVWTQSAHPYHLLSINIAHGSNRSIAMTGTE